MGNSKKSKSIKGENKKTLAEQIQFKQQNSYPRPCIGPAGRPSKATHG